MEKLKLTKTYEKYSEYKDSGVEWLGKIPKEWDAIKFKANFKVSNERVSDDPKVETLLSVSGYRGIETKNIDSLDGQMPSEDVSDYRIVRRGQLVVNTMWLNYTGLGVSKYEGYVSPAYRSYNISEKMFPDFVNHIMRSGAYVQKYSSLLYGIRPNSLQVKPHDFEKIEVLMPSTEVQKKIANYLNEKTASIDQIIKKKQKQIELLREKRTAVINHAVTKGLDPNVELVESGIDWIGKMPKGWEVKKLKHFFRVLDGIRIPLSAEERTYKQGEYPYYGASGVIDYVDAYLFEESLVLVSEDGANLLNRSTPIAFVAQDKYWVNNHAHILKPHDSEVFFWAERIEQVDMSLYTSGSAQPKLTIEALKNIVVSAPRSMEEKVAISRFVIEKNNKFNLAIQKAEKAIALLQEFKSSLISHVVTGKVKV